MQHLAEVISASITSLTAEAGNSVTVKPRFGSFIRVDSPENALSLFAVVYDVITGPPDNVHKPSALGLSREQLREEQPHIFSLLKTQIHAQIVGFREEGKGENIIYQYLPPQPPEVHDFVYAAGVEETIALTEDFEFLRLLTQVNAPPADELIAAAIREAARARSQSERYLVEAGRAITQLFRSDYEHMLAVVRKIRPRR